MTYFETRQMFPSLITCDKQARSLKRLDNLDRLSYHQSKFAGTIKVVSQDETPNKDTVVSYISFSSCFLMNSLVCAVTLSTLLQRMSTGIFLLTTINFVKISYRYLGHIRHQMLEPVCAFIHWHVCYTHIMQAFINWNV